ncbi:MAG: hypothetical protein G5Z42_06530 [Caldisphaeraceae archaeon]|nr:hypothetical protein [Caldisphaeraceae archaeon]MEB3691940.1 hypothetical protein [Caldisphaeraceae archaeon]MEB3798454.1 hypothetical protein [Caldisphaeraceae archaeon]
MKALIIGLLEENSGKTTIASSLTSYLNSEGFDTVAFKPIGATEVWLSPFVLKESKKRKMVVTGDSLLLHRASSEKEPINIINPFGGLLVPLILEKFATLNSFKAYQSSVSSRLALSRLTLCRGEIKNLHLINEKPLRKTAKSIEYEIYEIVTYAENPVKVDEDYLVELLSGGATNEIDACLSYLEERHEIVVIESNSDVASPTRRCLESDVVILVSPGFAMVIDGNRFRKAVEVLTSNGKPWVIKSEEIAPLTKHIFSVELPLLYDQMEGYPKESLDQIIEYIKGLRRK